MTDPAPPITDFTATPHSAITRRTTYEYHRRILYARLWAGRLFYGSYGPRTIRTGPRTIVKLGRWVDESEAEAMRFIAENTTVPVPKVYSVRKYGRVTAIEMEFVRGREATHAWNTMSVEAQRALLEELISYVKQLRSLTPPAPELVASATGGHCVDHRFGVRPSGPFTSHEEFHRFLREGDELWQWDNYPEVAESHTKTYISKFTHGDLLPRNVMVHKGRISAIIDWDSAGWRPEYWEVTKAHFAALGAPKEWIQALESATGSTYEVQLKAELKLWTAAEFPTSLGGRLAGIDKTRENQTRDAA